MTTTITGSGPRARLLLHLQRQIRVSGGRQLKVRITGAVHIQSPYFAGDPTISELLRDVPTAKIEAALDKRLCAVTGASRFRDSKVTLPSGRVLGSVEVSRLPGDPKLYTGALRTRPLQHSRLSEGGDPNATATITRINDVSIYTSQLWVARALARGSSRPADAAALGRDSIGGRQKISGDDPPSRNRSRRQSMAIAVGSAIARRPRRDGLGLGV